MYASEPFEIAVNLDREPLQISLTTNKKESDRSNAAHRQRPEPRPDRHAGGRSTAATRGKIWPSKRTWCSHAQLSRARCAARRVAAGAGRMHGGEENVTLLVRLLHAHTGPRSRYKFQQARGGELESGGRRDTTVGYRGREISSVF
jgi:hypothetical protein